MTTPTQPDPLTTLVKSIFGNPGKSAEKFLLYIGGVLTSTNVFGATTMGTSLREWLTASVALAIAGLHISTPTPKSGPGQL